MRPRLYLFVVNVVSLHAFLLYLDRKFKHSYRELNFQWWATHRSVNFFCLFITCFYAHNKTKRRAKLIYPDLLFAQQKRSLAWDWQDKSVYIWRKTLPPLIFFFFFVQKISNDSFLMFRNLPITNLSGQLPSVFSLWHCFSCDAKANAGRPWIGSECAFLFTNWLETYPRNCNTTHGALFPRDDSRFGAQTICLYRRASFAVALR